MAQEVVVPALLYVPQHVDVAAALVFRSIRHRIGPLHTRWVALVPSLEVLEMTQQVPITTASPEQGSMRMAVQCTQLFRCVRSRHWQPVYIGRSSASHERQRLSLELSSQPVVLVHGHPPLETSRRAPRTPFTVKGCTTASAVLHLHRCSATTDVFSAYSGSPHTSGNAPPLRTCAHKVLCIPSLTNSPDTATSSRLVALENKYIALNSANACKYSFLINACVYATARVLRCCIPPLVDPIHSLA